MNRAVRKVAVVGTGTLGTQIAIQAASYGYGVKAFDKDKDSFARVFEGVKAVMKLLGKAPTLPLEDWEKGASRVIRCTDLAEAIRDADLVIEAVPENLELKKALFSEMDLLAPAGAILATNSSSIPISMIEGATKRPENCVNMHFYQPAVGMNMVDVMGGSRTDPQVMEVCKEWVRSIGCVPLTVKKELLGFCFNRVWRAVKRETLFMWAEGYVDFRDIDKGWMIFTGMPMGPFGLMDQVGLDVIYDIEMVYYQDSKDPKDRPPAALKAMVERGELGLKTGKGFYSYPDPEFKRPEFLKG